GVFLGGLLGGALFLELRDVGAQDKGLAAGAGDDDDADRIILLEIVHDLRHRLPHVERDGVVARRVVEDDAADRTLLLGEHLRGDRLVEHGGSRSSYFPTAEWQIAGAGASAHSGGLARPRPRGASP